MRTTKVRLTALNYKGIPTEMYLRRFLLLRTISKVGDTETVNNYQLGLLNEAKSYGQIDYEKIK